MSNATEVNFIRKQIATPSVSNALSSLYGGSSQYETSAIYDAAGNVVSPRFQRVICPTNSDSWCVKRTYDILQPMEIAELVQPVLDRISNVKIESVGLLKNGQGLFLGMNCGQFSVPNQNIAGDDVIAKKLTLMTGFNGDYKTRLLLSTERFVCSNGMTLFGKVAWEVNAKHTRNQRLKLASSVDSFTGINRSFDDLQRKLAAYAATPLSSDQADDVLKQLIPGDSTRSENVRKTIKQEFRNPQRGTFGETVFDMMNAFTAYNSHERNFRSTTTASRQENRFVSLSGANDTDNRQVTKLGKILDSIVAA